MYTEIIKYDNPFIKAEIVADSINIQGDRLTTFVCTFPRIILSEFNTHRLFSRNSASSRAIPFKKMMAKILDEPFIPSGWMAEHKGMQGTKYIIDKKEIKKLRHSWLVGRDAAVATATTLHNLGLTKQICNRITEPYMMHTVIVTACNCIGCELL